MRLTLTLAWALQAQPPVHVHVSGLSDEAQAQRLHGDLLVRLLEEGYPVAGIADAAVTLTVAQNDDGSFDLVAETSEERVQRSVQAGPPSAVRLELLHRSVHMLRSFEPRHSGLEHLHTISIEVVDPQRRDRIPDPDLVQTVLTPGVVVLPANGDPTWRICVVHSPTGWSFLRVRGDNGCDEAFLLLDGGRGDDRERFMESLEREVSAIGTEHDPHQGDEQALGASDVVSSAPAASNESVSDASLPPTPSSRGLGWIWLSAGAGALFRLEPIDVNVPLAIGATHRTGFGAMVRAALVPSKATGALDTFESAVAAGPGWHGALRPRFGLGVGLLFGVLVHRYRFEDESPSHAAYFDFQLPVWIAVRVAGGFAIAPGLELGISTRARRHRVDGTIAWERSAVRLGVGASILYAWGWP